MPDKTFDLAGLEFIELNKLLKLLRLVNSGGEANQFIDQGEVYVNGVVETRRRRKLRNGDVISFQNSSVRIN
jgi:ribosome-associated protein